MSLIIITMCGGIVVECTAVSNMTIYLTLGSLELIIYVFHLV